MIELPSHIKIGAYVQVAEWVGLVEDIAVGETHVLVLVSSPKQIYRHAPPEWLEFHADNPDMIRPAIPQRYWDECRRYSERLKEDIRKVAKHLP